MLSRPACIDDQSKHSNITIFILSYFFGTLKTEYFRKLPSSCLGNIPTEITTDSRLHQYFFFAMMQKKSNLTPLMRYSGIIARKDSVDKRKEKFL